MLSAWWADRPQLSSALGCHGQVRYDNVPQVEGLNTTDSAGDVPCVRRTRRSSVFASTWAAGHSYIGLGSAIRVDLRAMSSAVASRNR